MKQIIKTDKKPKNRQQSCRQQQNRLMKQIIKTDETINNRQQ